MTPPTPRSARLILCGITVVALWADSPAFAEPKSGVPENLDSFVAEYCLECHDADSNEGELDLEPFLDQPLSTHPEIWEKVIRRLDARQMPPPKGRDRPDEATYVSRVKDLTGHFDQRSHKSPDPGRTDTIRRLSRTEYRNAIRDLLHLNIDVSEMLPADESSHGFDNITLGTLSPTLLNRYISAAQKISRLAVGRNPGSPELRVVRVPADLSQHEHVEGLPLGTRGGVLIDHNFPVAGEYDFKIRLTRDRNDEIEGLNGTHFLDLLVNGERLHRFTVKPAKGKDKTRGDAHLHVRVNVPAGPAKVGVTFAGQSRSLIETRREPYAAQFNFHRHPRQGPAVFQISITGPFEKGKPQTNTPTRDRIFTRIPGSGADEDEVAEEIIATLVRRAYRRPAGPSDLERPMQFFREARDEDGFEAGIEMALSSILVSPRFLVRVENDPAESKPGTVYRLDDIALASRLSFFLWSSIPDDALLDLAERGELSKPEVLEQQTRRMLADPKSQSLVTSFADQWLHLRNLDSVNPDLRMFPDFDDNLRRALRRETELHFESILRGDRSVLDLLDPNHTFLNERLAKHYGISGIQGSRFRKVMLGENSDRGGLLRQGSILTVTSYANRTSPVIRGNWILENIIGTPAPPPPSDVPSLDNTAVSAKLPIRERLAAHREIKSCAVCHNLMDPVGFSLENYDALGRWRNTEGDRPIDATGGFPDGQEFDGIDGLEKALLDRPDLFVRTMTEKLLTFALGRGLGSHDAPAVRQIVRESKKSNYRFSDIVIGIVKSVPFTMKKSSS